MKKRRWARSVHRLFFSDSDIITAMKKDQNYLVVGNWKMNPTNLGAAKKLFIEVRKRLRHHPKNTDVVIAPPFPFISEMERLSPSKRIELAAQDVFFETSGAHTGEVSVPMLKSVGCEYVIAGHSEMRASGESDHDIYRDIKAVLKSRMTVIVCIGEKTRDSQGNYFSVVEAQIRSAIRDVPQAKLKQVVVAYEPVWAIGTGKHATPEDVEEMKLFIQKILADNYNRSAAMKVRILYGGSVKKNNSLELLERGKVDGFLIGGASLKAAEFSEIVKTTETYAKA